MIIKKPDYLLKEKDIGRASVLQEVISMRYPLKNQNQKMKEVDFQKPLKEASGGPIDNVFLSREIERLGVVYNIEEQKNIYLSSGNLDEDNAQRYALVAFLDWKQVPIMDNRDILFTSVPPDTKQIFNIELPSTDTQKNYQILDFPQPFDVSEENFYSQRTFGTIRTIVKPKN